MTKACKNISFDEARKGRLMKQVIFGKTGLKVSPIAFGGILIMRLSTADAIEVVKESLNLGG